MDLVQTACSGWFSSERGEGAAREFHRRVGIRWEFVLIALCLAVFGGGCHLPESIDANDRAWQRASGEPRFLRNIDNAIATAKHAPSQGAKPAPEDDLTVHTSMRDINLYYGEKYRNADPQKLKRYRDEAIYDCLKEDDRDFENYYLYFGIGQRSLAFENDLVVLGLSTAGAITHGEQAKSVLAGLAAFATGARIAFDKEIFFQNTFPALVSQMKTSRAEKRKAIEADLSSKSDADYPLTAALSDVREYSSLGTLTGILPVLGHAANATATQSSTAQLDQFAKTLAGQILTLADGSKYTVSDAAWNSDYTQLTIHGTGSTAKALDDDVKQKLQFLAIGLGPDVASKVGSATVHASAPAPAPPPAGGAGGSPSTGSPPH